MNVDLHPAAAICEGCGTSLSPTLLACPGCHRLVHGARLKELAAEASAAGARGDTATELAAWRSSLELLPERSRQYTSISDRVARLSECVDSARAAEPPSGRWKWLATLGPAGLLLWKFKFLVVAVLSKGKLLLLGLTKTGTLLSMFATVGLYWTRWGLWFALGLVISIYIHEMGHVAALRRYGIRASAPMFVPGFGAFVRLKQSPVSPREDARIGLAGPVWGLGAAVAAAVGGQLGGGPLWLAVAHTGAWLNLFNLMPIWQLDGSRAFSALSCMHRWIATAALAGAWLITHDGIVLLVLVVAIGRSLMRGNNTTADRGALGLFVFLVVALAIIFQVTNGAARGT
jgi:Zn-dependent protease